MAATTRIGRWPQRGQARTSSPKERLSHCTSYRGPAHQIFFVGDGLSGSGSGEIQRFHVPPAATRLFFGFIDWAAPDEVPGHYGDNSGELVLEGVVRGG